MFNFIKSFFGTKSNRDIKLVLSEVKKINFFFNNFKNVSSDNLRHKIFLLRKNIRNKIKKSELKIIFLEEEKKNFFFHKNINNNIFEKIENIKKEYQEKLESVLNNIIAEVFAILKETVRRFKSNDFIKVKTKFYDLDISKKKNYVIAKKDFTK